MYAWFVLPLCPNEDGCYRCLPVLGEIRFRVSGVSQHMYYPVCGSVLKGRVRECENLPCLSGACSRSYPPTFASAKTEVRTVKGPAARAYELNILGNFESIAKLSQHQITSTTDTENSVWGINLRSLRTDMMEFIAKVALHTLALLELADLCVGWSGGTGKSSGKSHLTRAEPPIHRTTSPPAYASYRKIAIFGKNTTPEELPGASTHKYAN